MQKDRPTKGQEIGHGDQKTQWENGNGTDTSTNCAERGNTKNLGSILKL